MASTIILCFMLTILSILTINSIASTRVAEQTSLNHVVDASVKAIQLDKEYNKDNYEEIVNDLLQLILLQSTSDGNINVKILEANTNEGLLDVEVSKTYVWYGIKKQVVARRTVILEEFEHPPVDPATVMFIYYDSEDVASRKELIWREESTFEGAILKRPKNPKRMGYKFVGWSLTENGTTISDDEWQNYIVDTNGAGSIVFYAVFEVATP